MARPRSLFAGDTDYTGVSLEDIVEHLGRWRDALDSDLQFLANVRRRLAALEPLDANEVKNGLEYLDYFADLFARYSADIARLERELPSGALPRHVQLTRQLYQSSRSEEQLCVLFKQRHYLDALRDEDRVQNTLAEIYRVTRDEVINLRDLSNVVPRLETYVGSEALQPASARSAVNALELKPNVFGIGVNLNYVWDRWGLPAWRRRFGR
jgi:hypothetical protein